MKDVFSMSSEAIKIWLYPKNLSIKNNIEWPVVLSTSVSMCGKEKSSLRLALLRFRKSKQTLTLSSFLGIGTTLASHSGYSTIDKNPTLSCFWISSFTCKLQRGCNHLNFYLTGLTWGRSGKWCWIMDASRPDMSSQDHAKTSKYDLSNRARPSFSSIDKSNPILSSLNWSAVPKSTISASPVASETL